jgi:hypothetical protein
MLVGHTDRVSFSYVAEFIAFSSSLFYCLGSFVIPLFHFGTLLFTITFEGQNLGLAQCVSRRAHSALPAYSMNGGGMNNLVWLTLGDALA